MKKIRPLSTVALMLIICVPALSAGVLMVSTQEFFDGSKQAMTTKLHVESDRVRIEMEGAGSNSVIIFRGDRQVMWMLSRDDKVYREMTKADIERLGGQMSDMMAQVRKGMEEQMKNMSPQQRQMVEKMMKSRMGAMAAAPAPTAKTEYSKVAGGQKVKQWSCDKYEGTRNGEKRREVWTASPDQLGLDAGDFQVMRQMAEFFKGFSQFAGEAPFRAGAGEQGPEKDYSGVPVRQIFYEGGRPVSRTEVAEVQRQEFDPSLFELPEGFTKQPMMAAPGGRRGNRK